MERRREGLGRVIWELVKGLVVNCRVSNGNREWDVSG